MLNYLVFNKLWFCSQVASSWWKKVIIVTYLNRPLAFETLPLPVGGAYKSWLELWLKTVSKHGEREKRRVMTAVFLKLINHCLKAKRSTCPLLGIVGAERSLLPPKNGIAFSGSHEVSSLNYKSWVGFVNFITIVESHCFTENSNKVWKDHLMEKPIVITSR